MHVQTEEQDNLLLVLPERLVKEIDILIVAIFKDTSNPVPVRPLPLLNTLFFFASSS